MNNTVRFVFGILMAGALAALATPQLSGKLPEGVSTILAVAIAEMLRRMNSESPKSLEPEVK